MKKILASIMMVMVLSVSFVGVSGLISDTHVEAASWKTVDKKFYTGNISGEIKYNDGKSSGMLYLVAPPKYHTVGHIGQQLIVAWYTHGKF
ncbi:hypothetical protein [Listeria grandensis]|uniref:hypothetical protein n=1 Tax=Listeria grandensis TaxID=1494963 RepID=UPI00164E28DE|nr:hypothetical protein [Listeria grandensis]MBC6316959.1 hypothetical protein [Listeria grandensis]